jgi:rhodanese-related sulfurtransferase
MSRTTASELLAEARASLARVSPDELQLAVGALVVDVRDADERRAEGTIPGSVHVPLTVLEWRADPASESHDPCFDALDRLVVLVCSDGYASSLAAARLQRLGYVHATDLDGGFRAWMAAGLPVEEAG